MPRQRLPRVLVFATLLLLHVGAWRLASTRPHGPAAGASAPRLTTLRLLPPVPMPMPIPAREMPAPTRPPRRPQPAPAARLADTPLPATGPPATAAASTAMPEAQAPAGAASSPRPLDLRLRLAPTPGAAARTNAALAPAGVAGVEVPGLGREINLGDGRRRIFTADGRCFDSHSSRASQLDPFQPGMLRELKMVKPCD